jgi:hypothetical protein
MHPPAVSTPVPGFILVPIHLVATSPLDWSQYQQVYQAAYERARANERPIADRLQPIWN